MGTSLFSFNDVESKNPPSHTILTAVKDVLRANNGACYSDIEPLIMPPGRSGSRSFDQAYAVSVLLEHDENLERRIVSIMEKSNLSRRMLWDKLQKALKDTGFKMKNGRLVGILEDMRSEEEKNGDTGQPDID